MIQEGLEVLPLYCPLNRSLLPNVPNELEGQSSALPDLNPLNHGAKKLEERLHQCDTGNRRDRQNSFLRRLDRKRNRIDEETSGVSDGDIHYHRISIQTTSSDKKLLRPVAY